MEGVAASELNGISVHAIAQLPDSIRELYTGAFTAAIDSIVFLAAIVALIGFTVSWFMTEQHGIRT